ncbi:MAG: DeoR/GlpR transcriptional regulator, partial [Chloroflexi bacterium]|nr:DeoR/GlpR transcriptional regulator [Chloroflexota bacterium]
MLAAQRRQRILQLANVRGIVSIRELTDELKTPEVTVRRDLSAMAADGVLTRIRGDAMVPPGFAYEPSHAERAGRSTCEKEAIAELAATLVKPGAVLLGPGTTVQALARRLTHLAGLTVVTNSLLVLDALALASNVEVLMTGGTLRQSIHALVGPRLEHGLRGLHVSQVYLSG